MGDGLFCGFYQGVVGVTKRPVYAAGLLKLSNRGEFYVSQIRGLGLRAPTRSSMIYTVCRIKLPKR